MKVGTTTFSRIQESLLGLWRVCQTLCRQSCRGDVTSSKGIVARVLLPKISLLKTMKKIERHYWDRKIWKRPRGTPLSLRGSSSRNCQVTSDSYKLESTRRLLTWGSPLLFQKHILVIPTLRWGKMSSIFDDYGGTDWFSAYIWTILSIFLWYVGLLSFLHDLHKYQNQ